MCLCTLDMHATMQVEVRMQLVESVLFPPCGSEAGTQVVRLGNKCLSLLSHLASPLLLLHIIKLEVGSYLQRCDYTTLYFLLSSRTAWPMKGQGSPQMCSHTETHMTIPCPASLSC